MMAKVYVVVGTSPASEGEEARPIRAFFNHKEAEEFCGSKQAIHLADYYYVVEIPLET